MGASPNTTVFATGAGITGLSPSMVLHHRLSRPCSILSHGCIQNGGRYSVQTVIPTGVRFHHILYFVDCASRYKFLLITNLTHFFMCLFISSLYMFRASSAHNREIELY